MRRLHLAPLSLAATLLAAAPAAAAAQHVVYWSDSDAGTSVVPGALSLLQGTLPGLTVTTATSQSHFNTLLASGSVDLAIFGEQGNNVFGASSSALGSYLAGGGRVLGTTWVDGGMASMLGATWSSTNFASIAGGGPLFAGIPGAVSLANPGWGVYAQGYATSETCLATASNGDCAAVLANDGRTLLVGPLFDAYGDAELGARFVANGAGVLLGSAPTVTPEPATVALLGTGLLGVGAFGLRRRRTEG